VGVEEDFGDATYTSAFEGVVVCLYGVHDGSAAGNGGVLTFDANKVVAGAYHAS
jgi:hypothetical protein